MGSVSDRILVGSLCGQLRRTAQLRDARAGYSAREERALCNAYLRLKQSAQAAAGFQKIIDHSGQAPLSPLYPLAYRGLANAADAAGDELKSGKALAEFNAFWKDADPGIAQQ